MELLYIGRRCKGERGNTFSDITLGCILNNPNLQQPFKSQLSLNVISDIKMLTSDPSVLDIAIKLADTINSKINVADFTVFWTQQYAQKMQDLEFITEKFNCPSYCTPDSDKTECSINFDKIILDIIGSCINEHLMSDIIIQNAINSSSNYMIETLEKKQSSFRNIVIVIAIIVIIVIIAILIYLYKMNKKRKIFYKRL